MKLIIFLLILLCSGLSYSQDKNITAKIPYNNEFASGTYRIYRNDYNTSISLNQVSKPIIFVEGFDPNNEFSIDNLYGILDYNSLANTLHKNGHDIIVLNFSNGGDYIQKNAYLLIELINQINNNKPNKTDDLIVIGFSMGGLVSRYALSYMEKNSSVTGSHQTKLFVSFDSPQKGAHVPVGIQALTLTFSSDLYKSIFPDLATSLNLFNAPAAKQMLKYRLSNPSQLNGEIPVSIDYLNFMNEINNLNGCNGYPKKSRNIAL